jgi:hypothetical protein
MPLQFHAMTPATANRSLRTSLRSVLAAGLLALAMACGGAEIGETCDDQGSTDECVDDAVCTNEDDGAVCRALCDEHEDCPDGHSCNGISQTSLKSCQPD